MDLFGYFKGLAKKKIFIIISPRFINRSYSITISQLTILISMVVLFLFISANIYLGFNYSDRIALKNKVNLLKIVDKTREMKISHLSQRIEQLESQLKDSLNFSDDLCLLYDEEPISDKIDNLAIGGHLEGIDAELMKDIRLSNLSELYQKVKIQYTSEKNLMKKLDLQMRIWKFTPTLKPTGGPIVSGFGYRRNPLGGGIQFHRGLDIVMPFGAPVVASADGIVSSAEMKSGYGLCVVIDHKFGFKTRYAHLSKITIKAGDTVSRGQVIGFVGATGWATGSHLHYEVMVNNIHDDPMKYILPDYIED
ncbi:MAG: M23 family metallopeptidase [bacterium]